MEKRNKVPLTVRVTPETYDMVIDMARSNGLSQGAIIELAMRALARTKAEHILDRGTSKERVEA
jgi:hypothetical protein